MHFVCTLLFCICAIGLAGQPRPVPRGMPCEGLAGCGIVDSKLICGPAPELSKLAETANIRGAVHLGAVIGKDGSVQSLRLVSGHPPLIAAAMEAAKQ